MEICLYFSNNNQFDIRELSTIDTFYLNRNCKACKENEEINIIKFLPFLCKPWYQWQRCSCEKLVTVNPYIFSWHFVANEI